MIFSQVDYEDNNKRELINSVLRNSKVKIPIFCELRGDYDYWMGIGKVLQELNVLKQTLSETEIISSL